MIFDYCELELLQNGFMSVAAGCRFVDEPDELYVIMLEGLQDGTVTQLKLYFNGIDCKYVFKPEELIALKNYVDNVIPSTAYADWFKEKLKL